jgi:malonyl-CoA O-methyltransferase
MVRPDGGKPGALSAAHAARRFERAAPTFDAAGFVHRHAAEGLMERMAPMLVTVDRILDAGSATGSASRSLAKLYRRSRIVSLDRSGEMLRRARKLRSRFSKITELQADAAALPLQQESIDLVFSNMLLPWMDDLEGFFVPVNRVLRKDGLFVFSTLGPDSLREVREAWARIDHEEHVNTFIDMHDIGDALVRSGLREPVLDVEHLTITYRSVEDLFADLTRCAARNCLQGRRRTLTGRRRFDQMKRALADGSREGALHLELELVFGHAWGGGPVPERGEFRLDVSQIGRRSRQGL